MAKRAFHLSAPSIDIFLAVTIIFILFRYIYCYKDIGISTNNVGPHAGTLSFYMLEEWCRFHGWLWLFHLLSAREALYCDRKSMKIWILAGICTSVFTMWRAISKSWPILLSHWQPSSMRSLAHIRVKIFHAFNLRRSPLIYIEDDVRMTDLCCEAPFLFGAALLVAHFSCRRRYRHLPWCFAAISRLYAWRLHALRARPSHWWGGSLQWHHRPALD